MNIAVRAPVVRQLAMPDMLDVFDLEGSVAALAPEGFIRPKDDGEVHGYLDGTLGAAYGVVDGMGLSAVSLLRLPSEAHANAGLTPFPRVPAADWQQGAAFLENTMVRRAARGRGYQRMLLDARIEHAERAGMRWVCSGVHLDNVVSWSNLMAKGMAIVGIRFDPGYPVIGLLKGFQAGALASDHNDHVLVPLADAKRHEMVIDAGYVGVRPIGDTVVYQRLIADR
jgi:GNAT superfamily N-acetyltransferase